MHKRTLLGVDGRDKPGHDVAGAGEGSVLSDVNLEKIDKPRACVTLAKVTERRDVEDFHQL